MLQICNYSLLFFQLDLDTNLSRSRISSNDASLDTSMEILSGSTSSSSKEVFVDQVRLAQAVLCKNFKYLRYAYTMGLSYHRPAKPAQTKTYVELCTQVFSISAGDFYMFDGRVAESNETYDKQNIT